MLREGALSKSVVIVVHGECIVSQLVNIDPRAQARPGSRARGCSEAHSRRMVRRVQIVGLASEECGMCDGKMVVVCPLCRGQGFVEWTLHAQHGVDICKCAAQCQRIPPSTAPVRLCGCSGRVRPIWRLSHPSFGYAAWCILRYPVRPSCLP